MASKSKMSNTTKLLLVAGLTTVTGVAAFRWQKKRRLAESKRRRLAKRRARKAKQQKELRKAA